jgi:hypothetical protein
MPQPYGPPLSAAIYADIIVTARTKLKLRDTTKYIKEY